jgi:RNA polymerase sigma factor (sigma-70 family)
MKPATLDEEIHPITSPDPGPDGRLIQSEDRQLLNDALEGLAAEYREVIVLRELEGLSYKEIASIISIPIGTVMSRLARGRERLQQALTDRTKKET